MTAVVDIQIKYVITKLLIVFLFSKKQTNKQTNKKKKKKKKKTKKTGFDIMCELSPMETICIKCRNLFSGRKNQYVICCNVYPAANT